MELKTTVRRWEHDSLSAINVKDDNNTLVNNFSTNNEIIGIDRPVRFAHLSDIHVTANSSWTKRDIFSKRFTGWINLKLFGRGFRFRNTTEILVSLMKDIKSQLIDSMVFSGDATALGFEEEMAKAAALLELDKPDVLPGLAVPGNHDYQTASCAASNHFENHFSPWQKGLRIENHIYPFAKKVGNIWVIAVNSSTPNSLPWDARGCVGGEQLQRLKMLFDKLDNSRRILVTHYPVKIANGKRERKIRALRDLDSLLQIAARGKVSLWLHGHRHDQFYHPSSSDVPFPVLCAGSATQNGRWSYSRYSILNNHLAVECRVYNPDTELFNKSESFNLELPFQY